MLAIIVTGIGLIVWAIRRLSKISAIVTSQRMLREAAARVQRLQREEAARNAQLVRARLASLVSYHYWRSTISSEQRYRTPDDPTIWSARAWLGADLFSYIKMNLPGSQVPPPLPGIAISAE